jgi:hypothetical protein
MSISIKCIYLTVLHGKDMNYYTLPRVVCALSLAFNHKKNETVNINRMGRILCNAAKFPFLRRATDVLYVSYYGV